MEFKVKINKDEFERIKTGEKTFVSIDETVQKGDVLILREWDTDPVNPTSLQSKGYTDTAPLQFEAGFIDYGKSKAIVSLLPLKPSKKSKS